jgi:phosphogluconate dehydratase
MAKVYPNGLADVNHFHAAGGLAVPDRPASGCGLLHEDAKTVAGGRACPTAGAEADRDGA